MAQCNTDQNCRWYCALSQHCHCAGPLPLSDGTFTIIPLVIGLTVNHAVNTYCDTAVATVLSATAKKKKRKKKTEALEINLWICSLNWLCEGWRGRRGCGRAEARPTCRPVIEKMSERNHSVVYIKRKDTSLLTWNTKVLGWYMHRIYPPSFPVSFR